MSRETDVLVLGAGIVGVSTALHLLQRGRRVTLIDRRGPGEETSYGNSGVIEASSTLPYAFPRFKQLCAIVAGRDTSARVDLIHLGQVLPFALRLKRHTSHAGRLRSAAALAPLLAASIAEHRSLMKLAGVAHLLTERGWAKIYRTPEGLAADAPALKILDERGIAYEVMSAPEFAATLEPDVAPVFHRAVWLKQTATVTNPGELTKAYARAFGASGGTVQTAEVHTLTPDATGAWRAATGAGEFTAPDVVVALGPWSGDLLRPLGYRLPLGIKRGYHRHYTSRGAAALRRSIVDIERGFVIAPMDHGYRLTTGAEFTVRDAPANPVQLAQVLPHARELFALDEPVGGEAWLGARPCMPDSLPVVGPAHQHEGLWLNFGHGHLGLTLGPVTGRMLAESMIGERTVCDGEPFASSRF